MSKEDLLAMLDLGGTDSAQTATLDIESAGPTEPPPDTALDVDEWGMRRGEDLVKQNDELAGALGWSKKADSKQRTLAERTAADMHAAAYELEPRLHEQCSDNLRHQFVKQLMDTAEYQELHQTTAYNHALADIAAVHFCGQFATLRQEEQERQKQQGNGKGGKPAPENPMAQEMRVLAAAGQALQQASKDVEEAQEASNALGFGGGNDAGRRDPKKSIEFYRRVRNSHQLRRICELAGKYRRLAQSRQRQKFAHGYDDMIGVELAGDVGRLLPHEMAKLNDDDLELDTLRRIVEQEAQCRHYRGMEKVAKGPIIVAIDESGSMNGERIYTAKALALAMAWIARKQRRWCALCSWSDRSCRKSLALPPGKWDELQLMAWLEHFFGGGTEPPLADMPKIYALTQAPKGKTDILMITDGLCHIDPEEEAFFRKWKAEAKVKMVTLSIGSDPGNLRAVSDEVHVVRDLGVEQEAVGNVLGI